MTKERKWILKDPADPEKVGRLSAELGIDRVLAKPCPEGRCPA